MEDWRILTSKHVSAEFILQTTSTIVVISDKIPRVDKFAQDRLRIFKIKGDDLLDVTKNYRIIGYSNFLMLSICEQL